MKPKILSSIVTEFSLKRVIKVGTKGAALRVTLRKPPST